jgi:AcrR family transcriptional regulator
MPSESYPAGRHSTRGDGYIALVEAARLEFEDHGFTGTNTNAIAKRAGYAPQTFYRHFPNKRAIFIAVYNRWTEEEDRALAVSSSPEEIAEVLITHHKRHRVFRRSLRMLTVEDDEVGAARAKARVTQIALIKSRSNAFSSLKLADQVATLLTIERMCDAAADGELERLGVDEIDAKALIVQMVSRFL